MVCLYLVVYIDFSFVNVHYVFIKLFTLTSCLLISTCSLSNRLVDLVVKASASRAGGPGFESR